MPKFIVKMPIELNGKLYAPPDAEFGKTSKSRGSGSAIPVDSSGFIVLTDLQATQMACGQIQPIAQPAKPEKPPEKAKGGKNGD